MLYLFGCLVSSIAFGILLICKIVDMVHSTNTDKLKDYIHQCEWLGNIVVALFHGFD